MLVMRFADVQQHAPLSLLRHFAVQYKSPVINIIIKILLQLRGTTWCFRRMLPLSANSFPQSSIPRILKNFFRLGRLGIRVIGIHLSCVETHTLANGSTRCMHHTSVRGGLLCPYPDWIIICCFHVTAFTS